MPASIEKSSPCKVNLLLNILGKREDGFHELETVMQPVNVCDLLAIERTGGGIELTCNRPELPVDSSNLVYRAAEAFGAAAGVKDGVRIHLEKRIPVAAGLGGGSANAAVTLLGLNEMFGNPLETDQLNRMAGELGSDVPFFLQSRPALAVGRGEQVESLDPFPALAGMSVLLIRPGFGVSTAWAYKNLARFPEGLNGKPGRARRLVDSLQGSLNDAAGDFYNSLEFPVLEKYPWLVLLQRFLKDAGALVVLMSGSGSTTFAVMPEREHALELQEKVKAKFGDVWADVSSLGDSP